MSDIEVPFADLSDSQKVDLLNKKHAVSNRIEFKQGKGELVTATIKDASGFSVDITLMGAHVTNWTTPDNKELLFVSDDTEFKVGEPIRGGIPLVFFNFGKSDEGLPQHGKARISNWEVENAKVNENGSTEITFKAPPSVFEGCLPPGSQVKYQVTLDQGKLTTTLMVYNASMEPIEFDVAFHTYFNVGNKTKATIDNLKGCEYGEDRNLTAATIDNEQKIIFTESETCMRVYKLDPNKKEKPIVRYADGTEIEISIEGETKQANLVVWAPNKEAVSNLPIKDVQTGQAIEILCAEPAWINPKAVALPSEYSIYSQTLTPRL